MYFMFDDSVSAYSGKTIQCFRLMPSTLTGTQNWSIDYTLSGRHDRFSTDFPRAIAKSIFKK